MNRNAFSVTTIPRVHEHADGDRDASEAHDVGRNAAVVHREERHEHGERKGQRHDEDRAHVHEEHHVRHRYQGDLLEQCDPKRVDGSVDEARAVVEGHDANALGQPGLNLGDADFHAVDDLACVRAAARHHHTADGFVRTLDQRGYTERVADVHVGHLAHEHGHTVRGPNDDVGDVVDRFDQADAPTMVHVPLASRTLPPTFRLLRRTASTTALSGRLYERSRFGSTST